MPKRSKIKALFSALVVLTVALSVITLPGCQKKKEVKIGIVAPFSGPGAIWGDQFKQGIELALSEIPPEERSSIHLIYEDSEADPKKAVSAVQKLISADQVQVIIGPLTSNGVLSAAPIAEESGVVLLTPTAPHRDITNAGDYIFRTYPSDQQRSTMLAEYTVEELNAAKVGIIFRGDEFGLAVKNEYTEKLKELGIEEDSITAERYEPEETDFRTAITKMKAQNPRVVLIVGHFRELGFIVKQSYEMKFHPQFLSTADFEHPEVLKIAGDAAEGVIYGSIIFNVASSDPLIKSFRERYQEQFNTTEEPGIATALSYDAFRVVYHAVENAKRSTSESIKEALYQTKDFPAVTGNITFDENGDVTKSWGLKIVRDDKFEVLMEHYPPKVQQ